MYRNFIARLSYFYEGREQINYFIIEIIKKNLKTYFTKFFPTIIQVYLKFITSTAQYSIDL